MASIDFQEVYNAPAAATLLPPLAAAELAPGRPNAWTLDAPTRAWLAGEAATNAGYIVVRLTGPVADDALFAWDSGFGELTAGLGPQLIVELSAAPAIAPTEPSPVYTVATLPPTPANVYTVAARARVATADAQTTGTYTPTPANQATPTPLPANLATVQYRAMERRLPPVVAGQPALDPAVAAAYATAVALTTGTFTPTPYGAVPAAVIVPTETPAHVVTAAAHYWAHGPGHPGRTGPSPTNALMRAAGRRGPG